VFVPVGPATPDDVASDRFPRKQQCTDGFKSGFGGSKTREINLENHHAGNLIIIIIIIIIIMNL